MTKRLVPSERRWPVSDTSGCYMTGEFYLITALSKTSIAVAAEMPSLSHRFPIDKFHAVFATGQK